LRVDSSIRGGYFEARKRRRRLQARKTQIAFASEIDAGAGKALFRVLIQLKKGLRRMGEGRESFQTFSGFGKAGVIFKGWKSKGLARPHLQLSAIKPIARCSS